MKEAAIEKMVELSQFLLEKLQGQVIKMYNRASDKEKQIFKDKIKEVYPDSELLKKLG